MSNYTAKECQNCGQQYIYSKFLDLLFNEKTDDSCPNCGSYNTKIVFIPSDKNLKDGDETKRNIGA